VQKYSVSHVCPLSYCLVFYEVSNRCLRISNDVNLLEYDARQDVNTGDHRPVYSVLSVDTRLPYVYFRNNDLNSYKIVFSSVRFEADQSGKKGDWEIHVPRLRQLLSRDNSELAFQICILGSGGNYDVEISNSIVDSLPVDSQFLLIAKLIDMEVSECATVDDFLDRNSLTNRIIALSIKELSRAWLRSSFSNVVRDICNLSYTLEMKLDGDHELQKKRVLTEVDKVVSAIVSSIGECPGALKAILKRIATAWNAKIEVERSKAAEARTASKALISISPISDQQVECKIVNSIFIKGLVSNALSSPTIYGIMSSMPEASVRKSLALLKEIIVRGASKTLFIQPHLCGLNTFIANFDAPLKFIETSLMTDIAEMLLLPTKQLALDVPSGSKKIEAKADTAVRVLYANIRRIMPLLSDIPKLQVVIGKQSCWDELIELIEPPKSDPKKSKSPKEKDLKAGGEKESAQLQVLINAPFSVKQSVTNFVNPLDAFSRFHSALSGGSVADAAWEWEDHYIAPLASTVNDILWLVKQHVFVEIKNKATDLTTGQCEISLGNARVKTVVDKANIDAGYQVPTALGGDGAFESLVLNHGVPVGTLKGSITIVPYDYIVESYMKKDVSRGLMSPGSASTVSRTRSVSSSDHLLAPTYNIDDSGFLGTTDCSQCRRSIKEAHDINNHSTFNLHESAPCDSCVIVIDGVDIVLCKGCSGNSSTSSKKPQLY
jgi:hypothetical protein